MDTLSLIQNFIMVYIIVDYMSVIFEISNIKSKIYLFVLLYFLSFIIDVISLYNIVSNFYSYLLMIVLVSFAYRLIIKDRKRSYLRIFIVGNIILYYLSIRGILISLYSIMLNKSMNDIMSIEKYYCFLDNVNVVVFIFIIFLFKFIYSKKQIEIIPKSDFKNMTILVYLCILMIWISSVPYYYNNEFIFLNYYNAINHLLCIVSNYIIYLYVYIRNNKDEYEIKSKIFENQLDYNLLNYDNKLKYIERLRSFKHDYRSVLNMVYTLLENNNISRLKNLLDEIECDFNDIENIYEEFSNDILLQAILTYFHKICSSKNIEFSGSVFLPTGIELTDYEKCVIFHNLLNNAYEACCINLFKHNTNYIKIYTKLYDDYFGITIENSFDGYLKKNKDEIISRKSNDLSNGFGIKNVADILKQKNGFFKICYNDDIFKFTLDLPIEIN